MHVVFAGTIPVAEFDAELERGLRLAHELRFVDPQQLVEVAQRRQRGLAHAHRADVVGFDEREAITLRMQHLRAGGSTHPAGGTAADDHDVQGAVRHEDS